MKTKFLRFDSEQTFFDVMKKANLTHYDEEQDREVVQTSSHNHFIDVIGEITRTVKEPVYDDDGEVVEEGEYETLEGYHANWRGTLPQELREFVIDKPNKPARVIAGDKIAGDKT